MGTTTVAQGSPPPGQRLPDALNLVGLVPLMARTAGDPGVVIGLLDGPVVGGHADLSGARIRSLPGNIPGICTHPKSVACLHGTFVAGILSARRGATSPAICPDCTLMVRPIFGETVETGVLVPNATPQELATALIEMCKVGARVINLSAALAQPSSRGEVEIEQALDYAARRGVLVIVAAGNQGMIGSTAITRHPWVIPVAACGIDGRPIEQSNLSKSIARQGLRAPGDHIAGLGTDGKTLSFSGTSIAAPFVTGTIALLWSLFPSATAAAMRAAVTQGPGQRRATIIPPLLDALSAYRILAG
jgi:subtilisin family serine protease